MRSIVLIGFMGAGKSTVGPELAFKTNRIFLDLDAEIVKLAGKSIAQIFNERGEPYFRDLETAVLRSVDINKVQVIATGGGIIEREENWQLMRKLGGIVYLQASWDCLRNRLTGTTGRPLAMQEHGWTQVESLYAKREQYYLQADYVVNTENDDAVKVSELIASFFDADKGQ